MEQPKFFVDVAVNWMALMLGISWDWEDKVCMIFLGPFAVVVGREPAEDGSD